LSKINFPVVISGKNPGIKITDEVSLHANIRLVENPSEEEMNQLQRDAHIHVCYTFQNSGLKLKLLNALFKGRFVVANPLMTEGSGLETHVETGNTDAEIRQIIEDMINREFTAEHADKRTNLLKLYDNKLNAKKIEGLL